MKTKKRKYQRYTPTQKGAAVGLMKSGKTMREVCHETGISMSSLMKLKAENKAGVVWGDLTGIPRAAPVMKSHFKEPYDVDLKAKIKEMVRDEVMRVLNEVL